jgi:hypothetical protein
MERFELNIINKENNSSYKEFNNYIGVFENEQFIILLKNNTTNAIQTSILINNINVLSGKDDDKRWNIEPLNKLKLQCYQETTNGGSAFKFLQEGIIKIKIYEFSISEIKTNAWTTNIGKSEIKYNNYVASDVMEIKPFSIKNSFIEQPVIECSSRFQYNNLIKEFEIKYQDWTKLQSIVRNNDPNLKNRRVAISRFV